MRLILFFILAWAVACSQEPSESSTAPQGGVISSDRNAKIAPASEEEDQDAFGDEVTSGNTQNERTLGRVGLRPFENTGGRLLEYQLNLQYQTSDLKLTREQLYALASKYGFLRSSNANTESTPYMQIQFAVRSESIYDLLKELDKIGDLTNESIQVIDHTENQFIQSVRLKREDLRMVRRQRALLGDASAKNWADRESALEESENAADEAEIEKWRIQDKVRWATVAVYVTGPTPTKQIEVPSYQNAFIDLLNITLSLSYVLIYVLPIALIAAFIFFRRRKILQFFKGEKNP